MSLSLQFLGPSHGWKLNVVRPGGTVGPVHEIEVLYAWERLQALLEKTAWTSPEARMVILNAGVSFFQASCLDAMWTLHVNVQFKDARGAVIGTVERPMCEGAAFGLFSVFPGFIDPQSARFEVPPEARELVLWFRLHKSARLRMLIPGVGAPPPSSVQVTQLSENGWDSRFGANYSVPLS